MSKIRADYTQLLYKEANVYKQIILNRWIRLDSKSRGVQFERVECGAQAIHFKIATAKKNIFNVWKSALPQGVHALDLIDRDTLLELSLACQRRVTAHSDINGLWVIVHRSESEDDANLQQLPYLNIYPR